MITNIQKKPRPTMARLRIKFLIMPCLAYELDFNLFILEMLIGENKNTTCRFHRLLKHSNIMDFIQIPQIVIRCSKNKAEFSSMYIVPLD